MARTAIKSAAKNTKATSIKTANKKGANKAVVKSAAQLKRELKGDHAAMKKKAVIELTTGQINSKCREFKSAIKNALNSKDVKAKDIDVNYMGNGVFNVSFSGVVKVGGYNQDYDGQFDVSSDGKIISEIGYTAPYVSYEGFHVETLDVIAKKTPKNTAIENFSKGIDANVRQHEDALIYVTEQIKIVRQFNNSIALALNAFTKTKFSK